MIENKNMDKMISLVRETQVTLPPDFKRTLHNRLVETSVQAESAKRSSIFDKLIRSPKFIAPLVCSLVLSTVFITGVFDNTDVIQDIQPNDPPVNSQDVTPNDNNNNIDLPYCPYEEIPSCYYTESNLPNDIGNEVVTPSGGEDYTPYVTNNPPLTLLDILNLQNLVPNDSQDVPQNDSDTPNNAPSGNAQNAGTPQQESVPPSWIGFPNFRNNRTPEPVVTQPSVNDTQPSTNNAQPNNTATQQPVTPAQTQPSNDTQQTSSEWDWRAEPVQPLNNVGYNTPAGTTSGAETASRSSAIGFAAAALDIGSTTEIQTSTTFVFHVGQDVFVWLLRQLGRNESITEITLEAHEFAILPRDRMWSYLVGMLELEDFTPGNRYVIVSIMDSLVAYNVD